MNVCECGCDLHVRPANLGDARARSVTRTNGIVAEAMQSRRESEQGDGKNRFRRRHQAARDRVNDAQPRMRHHLAPRPELPWQARI